MPQNYGHKRAALSPKTEPSFEAAVRHDGGGKGSRWAVGMRGSQDRDEAGVDGARRHCPNSVTTSREGGQMTGSRRQWIPPQNSSDGRDGRVKTRPFGTQIANVYGTGTDGSQLMGQLLRSFLGSNLVPIGPNVRESAKDAAQVADWSNQNQIRLPHVIVGKRRQVPRFKCEQAEIFASQRVIQIRYIARSPKDPSKTAVTDGTDGTTKRTG
ncbi:hypothetical protein K438DRAFT_1767754 [Mycena galopus ATCC 62051]|nr:hypothetical protein K438DRAFT_1767754 [Mycena galopus ATCC 62051]